MLPSIIFKINHNVRCKTNKDSNVTLHFLNYQDLILNDYVRQNLWESRTEFK